MILSNTKRIIQKQFLKQIKFSFSKLSDKLNRVKTRQQEALIED